MEGAMLSQCLCACVQVHNCFRNVASAYHLTPLLHNFLQEGKDGAEKPAAHPMAQHLSN